MSVSLNNISQQVQKFTNKGTWQEITRAVLNAYSVIAEKSFYVGKLDGLAELDGSFIQAFREIEIKNDGRYYAVIPSTYLLLPHAMGIKWVSFTGGKTPFWMVSNWAMYEDLKSSVMGGHIVSEIEGTRCYFPNMTGDAQLGKTIEMRLACAYDTVDIDAPLNISGNMADQVVKAVIALYAPIPQPLNENIK